MGINGEHYEIKLKWSQIECVVEILEDVAPTVVPKNKKTPINRGFNVVPPGIEPGTHGFSVHCSTN